MSLQVHVENGITILRLKGDFLGGKETDELQSKIKELADSGNRELILNLSKVTYMTSPAIGALVGAHVNYVKRGARVRLCGVGDNIHQIFVMTHLVLVFGDDTMQTEEEALESLVA